MLSASAYLEKVKAATHTEELLEQRLEAAKSRMEGVSGIDYRRMSIPGSPNASCDGVHNAVERYMAIIEKLEEQRAFAALMIEQAFGMLDKMREDGCPEAYISVLELYYLWNWDTKTIAEKLKKSESRIRHMRKEVLAKADAYVPLDAA